MNNNAIKTLQDTKNRNVDAAESFTAALDQWPDSSLVHVIGQHALWVEEAMCLFVTARLRAENPGVQRELDWNLAEEVGPLGGVSHVQLMQSAYRKFLGIECADRTPGPATERLVTSMRRLFRSRDADRRLGTLAGFEGIAAWEFRTLWAVIHELLGRRNLALEQCPELGRYVTAHISLDLAATEDPEGVHGERMQEAIMAALSDKGGQGWRVACAAAEMAVTAWWDEIWSESAWWSEK